MIPMRRFPVLILGLTAYLLAACAPETGPGGGTTIHFYQFSLPGFHETFAPLIERFEREHAPYRVEIHPLPANTDDQHQFYITHLAESQTSRIDVLALDVIWMAEFARAGLLLPLGDLLPEEDWGRMFPAIRSAAFYDHRPYGVPYFIDGGLLYSRADLLRRHGYSAPPRTWPELIRMASTVLQREDDPLLRGFVWQGRQYEGLVCNFIEYLPGPLVFSGEESLEAGASWLRTVDFMRGLIHRHRVSPRAVLAMAEEDARQTFQNGRALFMRNWPYAWRLLQQEGSPVAGKIWASPLPGWGPDQPGHGALGGFLLGVSRHSAVPQGARLWVRFLSRPRTQRYLARRLGLTPPRSDLLPEGGDETRLPPELLEAVMRSTVPRPVTPLYIPLSQSLQAALSGALAGVYTPREAWRLFQTDYRRLSRILS